MRPNIAAKLVAGVSISKILDDVCDDLPDGEVNRQQLLNKQDIRKHKAPAEYI